ncbi:hypothetical protein NicSoilB4_23210 [Arthrobacter sp. NicSoilB4]|nr:hypothetical protein NicSoilB4_23210 [Arthrobacter sp. NicSoilB4]
MPYNGFLDGQMADFLWLRHALEDSGSGVDTPAAVIVETVQGEGVSALIHRRAVELRREESRGLLQDRRVFPRINGHPRCALTQLIWVLPLCWHGNHPSG